MMEIAIPVKQEMNNDLENKLQYLPRPEQIAVVINLLRN